MNEEDKILELEEEIKNLKKMESDFIFFLENTSDFIYFKDSKHRFTFTSNAFARLSNHSSWRELIGKNDFEIFPKEHSNIYYEKEKKIFETGKSLIAFEEPYYNTDGELCWVSSSKIPIKKNGKTVGLFGISRDITKIKKLQEELYQRANFDDLSGLFNRASFLTQSSTLINLARRENKSLALFYIDLNKFKQINDTYGHKAGDKVIQEVAKRFKENFRNSDIIGRIGGDEFLIFGFFPSENENLLKIANNNIINKITKPINFNGIILKTGCSIGISCYPKDGTNIDELISKADMAMYEAKQNNNCKAIIYNQI